MAVSEHLGLLTQQAYSNLLKGVEIVPEQIAH